MTTKEQRDEWRTRRGQGMTSAVGEYTPSEFWDLLDEVESLTRKVAAVSSREAVLEEAAVICEGIEAIRWDQYKRGHGPGRANPHTQGESDGAAQCATAIRALNNAATPKRGTAGVVSAREAVLEEAALALESQILGAPHSMTIQDRCYDHAADIVRALKGASIDDAYQGTRDWIEDATRENGNYTCRCMTCGHTFVGHKRRTCCRLCAAQSKPEDSNG